MARPPTPLELLRSKAGLSQAALARKAGVSREPITAIETRQPGRQVRTMTLVKIAAVLGVSFEDLLEEEAS